MRISPVLPAIVVMVTAIAAVYGCSLPLEGLPTGSGGSGGSGGAPPSSTSTSDVASASTGVIAATCSDDSDCGIQTPCASFACVERKCVQSITPDGTPLTTDLPGDCHKSMCKSGKPVTQLDPSDVEDDKNPCTTDTCEESGTTHAPRPTGDDCGSGQHCFEGQCLECGTAKQCPKSANACNIATCFNGHCGTAMDMDGTHCADASDCKSEGKCSNGACNQPNKSEGASCKVTVLSGVCNEGGCCVTKVCDDVCCLPFQHCGGDGKCTL